jgi:hypothetical protein
MYEKFDFCESRNVRWSLRSAEISLYPNFARCKSLLIIRTKYVRVLRIGNVRFVLRISRRMGCSIE